jgi:oligopeptidase B
LNKINSIKDFIDCAQWLIKEVFKSSTLMFAVSNSGGALILGAVVNIRPIIFKVNKKLKAVVYNVPFLDPLTVLLDDSLTLS